MMLVRMLFSVDVLGIVPMGVHVNHAVVMLMHMDVDPLAPHAEQDVAAQANEHDADAALEPRRARHGETEADREGAHGEQGDGVTETPGGAADDRRQAIAHAGRHAHDGCKMIRFGGVAHAEEEPEDEDRADRHAARPTCKTSASKELCARAHAPDRLNVRTTSATLHAWAMQPRGVYGASASKISLIVPIPASLR